MSAARALLDRGLAQLALDLSAVDRERLLAYLALIEKWNRVHALTSVRDPERMVILHLLDSLAVLGHVPEGSLADVGSGAGLPGIPIAIAQPSRPVALIEARAKKAAFLRQAVIELALANVRVEHVRVEERDPAQPRFRVVIARAWGSLRSFCQRCRSLVVPGGTLVAMKASVPAAELEELRALGLAAVAHAVTVPLLAAQRCAVVVRVPEAG